MIRASSIHRYRRCAGAPAAEASLPKEFTHRTAKWTGDGTLVHEALCDDSKVAALPDDLMEIVESMSLAAEYTIDKILPLGQEGIERLECVRERTAPFLVYYDGKPFIAGHPDLIQYGTIYGRRVAVILDFKSGYLDVPASECNDQLRAYSVGVWQESIGQDEPLAEVYAAIVPRFGRSTPVQYETDDLKRALLDLWEVHEATRNALAVRNPSVDACRYCPARATSACPETLHPPETLINMPSLINLSPKQKGELLTVCEQVAGNIKALREILYAELEASPEAVEGWWLAPGNVSKPINDTGKCYNVVAEYIEPEEFQALTKVKKKPLVDTLKGIIAEREGVNKKTAGKRVDEILAPVIEPKQGNSRLESKPTVGLPVVVEGGA